MGKDIPYEELSRMAQTSLPLRSLVDPDHQSFLHPENMPDAIAHFCRETDQPVPEDPPAVTRTVLESLALKYRLVLDELELLTGRTYEKIQIVGGGSKNNLLNQLTADATGRLVVAGPVEATALGNICMQMLATGAVSSLEEARELISRSFPTQAYEPRETTDWGRVYSRFKQYCAATSPQA